MKRLMVLLSLVPILTYGSVEALVLDQAVTATNTAVVSVTNAFPRFGKVVGASFYCQTNATGTVSIAVTSNSFARTVRTIVGPILIAPGSLVTNLPIPPYVAGDRVMVSVSTVSALPATNTSARVIVVSGDNR